MFSTSDLVFLALKEIERDVRRGLQNILKLEQGLYTARVIGFFGGNLKFVM